MSDVLLRGYMVHGLLRELCQKRTSGTVVCTAGDVIKTVRIWQGRVVAAGSNLIDDRLGEIIYREGLLSLDAFVDAAGKVTQNIRFGEVLVKQGLFSPIKLWEALNLQAREILHSIAFYPEMKISIRENEPAPQSEFTLQFNWDEVCGKSFCEASLVQEFAGVHRRRPALEIDEGSRILPLNDFERDLVGLVDEYRDFNELVDRGSRLSPIYTCRALHRLHTKAILRDSNDLQRKKAGEKTYAALQKAVDDSNVLFANISRSVPQERHTDWQEICRGAGELLANGLGEGLFFSAAEGFRFPALLAAFIDQHTLRGKAEVSFQKLWPDNGVNEFRNLLYTVSLYLFFEIHNKKFANTGQIKPSEMLETLRQNN